MFLKPTFETDIRDLLSYGISYLKENSLSEAQKETIPTQYISEDGNTEIGINWFKKGTTISHGGGTYGFSAYLLVDIENDVTIAVLTNTGDQNITDIHNYLLDQDNSLLLKPNLAKIDVPLKTLKTYEGVYKDSQYGLEITVTIKDHKLFGRVKGQNQFLFNALTATVFINRTLKAQLTFESSESEVTGFTLNQAGQNIALKKQ